MGSLQAFFDSYGMMLLVETGKTLWMVTASTALAYLIGLPLGMTVAVTSPGGLRPSRIANSILGWIVNTGRSIPFVILIFVLFPVTRALVGTTLGTLGAIPPLVIAAAPFVGRLVESSIEEIPPGVIEAAQASGASTGQIISKVLIREALPSLVRGFIITYIALLGYSAIAGMVGAGGLGDLAIRYGYYRYQDDVLIATLIVIVAIVAIIQSVGDRAAKAIDKR